MKGGQYINYIPLYLQDVESDAELLEIIRKAERKFDRQQSTKVNSITIQGPELVLSWILIIF